MLCDNAWVVSMKNEIINGGEIPRGVAYRLLWLKMKKALDFCAELIPVVKVRLVKAHCKDDDITNGITTHKTKWHNDKADSYAAMLPGG